MKYFLLLALFFVIFSCESDNKKIEKANQTVNALISNLSLKNWKGAYENYPNLKKMIGDILVNYPSFQITSTAIKDNKTIEVFGKSKFKTFLFKLKKIEGSYKIYKTYGLSGYNNSDIYNYIKNIGCIGDDDDIAIAKNCKNNEPAFNYIVKQIKKNIEKSISLESNTIRIDRGIPGAISPYIKGDFTIKNNSRFSVPKSSSNFEDNFNIYTILKDNRGREKFRSKYKYNYSDFGFGETISAHLIMKEIPKSAINSNNFAVEIIIKDVKFIEKIVGNFAKGSDCEYLGNLTD